MRDIRAYVLGLKRLDKWKGRFDIIYPSHGTFPVSPSIVDKLIDGAKKVMRHEVEGKKDSLFGHDIMVYDIKVAKILGDYNEK